MDTKRSVSPSSRGGSMVVAEHSPPQSPLSGPDEGVSFSGKFHLPPGFRFHPTDQELVLYYLRRKVCGLKIEFDVIAEINLYEFEPWDLPEISCLQTRDLEWYFFSPIDKKYPHGGRTNRSTCAGYWKATGKDREITSGSRIVGMKKTLVFYRGRAPKGERTDWVMREYRLTEKECERIHALQNAFVVCRVFKKSGPGPRNGEQYGAPVEDEEWESLPADGDDQHTSTPNNKTDTGSNNDCNPQRGESVGGNGSTSMNKTTSCDATSNIRGCTTWNELWVFAKKNTSMPVGVEVNIGIVASCLEMQLGKCMVSAATCLLTRVEIPCQMCDDTNESNLIEFLFPRLNEEDGQLENARDACKELVQTSSDHQEATEENPLEGLANTMAVWALQIVVLSGYVEASFKMLLCRILGRCYVTHFSRFMYIATVRERFG